MKILYRLSTMGNMMVTLLSGILRVIPLDGVKTLEMVSTVEIPKNHHYWKKYCYHRFCHGRLPIMSSWRHSGEWFHFSRDEKWSKMKIDAVLAPPQVAWILIFDHFWTREKWNHSSEGLMKILYRLSTMRNTMVTLLFLVSIVVAHNGVMSQHFLL